MKTPIIPKIELQRALDAHQSTIYVLPQHSRAVTCYMEALQHQLKPEPTYFRELLSLTIDNPASRTPTILRFLSQDTHIDQVRGMKAVIEFPQGIATGRYYSFWLEQKSINERHRMRCRICSDRATQHRGEYGDVPTCGNPHCVDIVDREDY